MSELPLRLIKNSPVCLLAVAVLLAAGTAITVSADDREREATVNFSVFHASVTTVLANPDSDGHQLGDLRVVSAPTYDKRDREVGRLDAMLVTAGIDAPNPDDEVRISNLIFVFGDGVDQIVVNGSGFYPASGGTIEIDSVLTRPVTGGSGIFAGANGWAETTHFPDDTWRHTFYLLDPAGDEHAGGRHRGGRSRGRR